MEFKRLIQYIWKRIRKFIRNMRRETKKLLIVALVAVLAGGFLGGRICSCIGQKKAAEELAKVTAKLKKEEKAKINALQEKLNRLQNEEEEEKPWYLVLVNNKNPMKDGYVPELTELEPDYSVDSRIAKAAKQMLQDAEDAGLHILICSAYRSVERQEQVFGQSMKERVKEGMGYWEAYEETALNVALPGTSEHALGLALDLISNQYTELDEKQETTAEAKWLKENCHKYGFILRYPPEKTNITGIIYEPWHYRYVGEEHAAKIMELGITLEEYMQEYYQSEEGGQ